MPLVSGGSSLHWVTSNIETFTCIVHLVLLCEYVEFSQKRFHFNSICHDKVEGDLLIAASLGKNSLCNLILT